MDRMKTFGIYALCIILFFIFSNVMMDVAVKSMYNSIGADIITRNDLEIDLKDARATYVNGYVEGQVTNKGEDKEVAYIKIDLFSVRNVHMGTKYVRLYDFRQNETRDFKMGFEFTDVEYCKLEVVNDVPANLPEDSFSTIEFRWAAMILRVLYYALFV